ncbi:MAG TPA: hypothetical protein VM368_04585 [Flavisolibacter sp.]|nr:hypothetical protein [Flavisolibacter sp.]
MKEEQLIDFSHSDFNSLLSLQPLIHVLKKMVNESKPGAKRLYKDLLDEIDAKQELLQSMDSTKLLLDHRELVETLLSTIFPPSTSSHQGIYAITFPFRLETIYSSAAFREIFLRDSATIKVSDEATNTDIVKANTSLAFNVILSKMYSLPVPITATTVHAFTDEETGLTRYYQIKSNAQFVNVKCINDKYSLPVGFSPQQSIEVEELMELFPLQNFQFEGIVVIDVTDVTETQVMTEIKSALLNINDFSDVEVYDELQQHVQTLIGLKDVKIGITPFLKKNTFFLYNEGHYKNSLLFKNPVVVQEKDRIGQLFQEFFVNKNTPNLYQKIDSNSNRYKDLLKYYVEQGAKSLILLPLKCQNGELIGILEVLSEIPGKLNFQHLNKIQSTNELFTLALEKIAESLEIQIDKIIKENFTAIQPAVEWKFTEAAFNYIQNRQRNEDAKMELITFNEVYPLYGAIDVRNSSVERSNSIQLDLLEQLVLAQEVINKAKKVIDFPLLNETQYRIEKYITAASETLLSDDEIQIYDFLQNHLDSILENLLHLRPELKKVVGNYFSALDSQRRIVYHHRKNYEESITKINDVLDRFMDHEQHIAQEVFPHYFERYITDGLEFNIYVGQSISPYKHFNEMYVRNLKLWQLSCLARAARLTKTLEKRLPVPLQTTQLILAQAIPLSISFRKKERKFDVDGAYNIRYEIVKKRIDKVHIRDSEERLTQPGKIAIVYSQHKELAEYLEYIEFLQHEGYLCDDVEHFELEDTQGISGLKAVRVDINFESGNNLPVKETFTKIIKDQVLDN